MGVPQGWEEALGPEPLPPSPPPPLPSPPPGWFSEFELANMRECYREQVLTLDYERRLRCMSATPRLDMMENRERSRWKLQMEQRVGEQRQWPHDNVSKLVVALDILPL